MIVITGANGFIGSNLAKSLQDEKLVLVDDFSIHRFNFNDKTLIEREHFFEWMDFNGHDVKFIYHIGAITDTLITDVAYFQKWNVDYTKQVWNCAVKYGIPLLYASSAATYGDGSMGYSDDHPMIVSLKPLNPYGDSKHIVDKWILEQEKTPPFWAGLKFFNVYGNGEYHKDHMASMIYKMYEQIRSYVPVRLFKYGEQQRDFVYVKDVISICKWFLDNQTHSGIYNIGTGNAVSFKEVAHTLYDVMSKWPDIEYVDMPSEIQARYQNYTQADVSKLRSIGYDKPFHTTREGIEDFVS